MKILFICTGNTCRSPIAEGLARQLLGPEFKVESAGIAAWDGDSISPNALAVLREQGIELASHKARRVTREILSEADWIIPMTKAHEERLSSLFPEFKQKIKRLGAWSLRLSDFDVSDPWGGTIEVYRQCAKDLEPLIRELKDQLDNLEGNSSN